MEALADQALPLLYFTVVQMLFTELVGSAVMYRNTMYYLLCCTTAFGCGVLTLAELRCSERCSGLERTDIGRVVHGNTALYCNVA